MNATQASPSPAAPGGTRITGFDAVPGAPGPSTELKAFGAAYVVVWFALLAFIYFTRRRHDALRLQVESLERQLQQRAG